MVRLSAVQLPVYSVAVLMAFFTSSVVVVTVSSPAYTVNRCFMG